MYQLGLGPGPTQLLAQIHVNSGRQIRPGKEVRILCVPLLVPPLPGPDPPAFPLWFHLPCSTSHPEHPSNPCMGFSVLVGPHRSAGMWEAAPAAHIGEGYFATAIKQPVLAQHYLAQWRKGNWAMSWLETGCWVVCLSYSSSSCFYLHEKWERKLKDLTLLQLTSKLSFHSLLLPRTQTVWLFMVIWKLHLYSVEMNILY